jgi:hypothetical protein
MSSDLKTVLDDACDIYISDLSLKNSWPDATTSLKMAEEAVLQANHRSRQKGGQVLDLDSTILGKVRKFGILCYFLLMVVLGQTLWFAVALGPQDLYLRFVTFLGYPTDT